MQTKEELAKLCSTFSDREFLDIVNEKSRYTENALSVASDEINKRDIKTEQVQDYIEEKVLEGKLSDHIAAIELTFFEKSKFFFFWLLPFIGFTQQMNYSDDGLLTKLKQSKRFSLLGFLTFLLIGVFAILFTLSNFESITIWILFFILTFFVEKRINNNK